MGQIAPAAAIKTEGQFIFGKQEVQRNDSMCASLLLLYLQNCNPNKKKINPPKNCTAASCVILMPWTDEIADMAIPIFGKSTTLLYFIA